MEIYNKIKWVLGIFMVFFLIVATNLIDKDNFTRVKNAVVTIYEDRLVAQDLIYKFLVLVQEKEIADAKSNMVFFEERNPAVNREIEELISIYLTTKLTAREEIVFNELQINFNNLYKLEESKEQLKNNSNYKDRITLIKENLNELSRVQMEEGRHQLLVSQQVIKSVELFTRMEIYLLIVLAVLVQIIVIYKPKRS